MKSNSNNYLKIDTMRVRRQSSRDAEEAMAGGLSKVNISYISSFCLPLDR
jgi:hypothetical protein